ncbi:hypothetical protein [Streptomyces sp. CAU 1734]|uniref:hypothetical protein n=1 Tax=Streptomyces sp. CAU 1734 TaxID=3140360 RepID=UPI0032604711
MGYTLEAVIAGETLLRTAAAPEPAAVVVPLGGGLALIPMTDELFDAVTDGTEPETGFHRLPGGFGRVLAQWSAAGPVAYVEAEFFGGWGEQHAVVWASGTPALGPLHQPEGEPSPPEGSPISQALRRLGVVVADGDVDEFETAGLGRHRFTKRWAG